MSPIAQFLFPPFRLDARNEQLWRGTEEIALRRKTFAVLRYLVEHAGRLVTKDQLLEAVWSGIYVSESLPTTCIREVRKALGDKARTPRFIETVHGRGYRFIAPISAAPLQGSGVGDQRSVKEPRNEVARRLEHAVSAPNPVPRILSPVLVGRETELAQLHHWLDKALSGARQIVFVTGEPGIGKTTLVEAFLAGIREQRSENRSLVPTAPRFPSPVPWFSWGQCIEHYGAGEAYMPMLEALGRLCKEPSGERLVALLHQYAPTWLAQLPALLTTSEREQLQREMHGVTRERMLREMAEVLEVLTAEHPLILWLEDLHWSDVSTLELLAVLARRPERARLLVIGSYRPVELLAHSHPLRIVKQELHVHGQCEELRLGLLTEDQVTQYLAVKMVLSSPRQGESWGRGSLSASFPKLAHLIHQRTEGNPLFMVNIVDYLMAEEKLTAALEPRQVAAFPSLSEMLKVVPTSLRTMIERQLDRLSVEEQQVLETASIVGARFSTAAVAEGLKQTTSAVEMCCARLARGEQFIQATGMSEWPDGTVATTYSFLHALYQEVLYERIPAGQRVILHKHIGEQEERAYGDQVRDVAAELAVHFERGREYPRAVRYLGLAGETANQRSAHHEAIVLLTKGLELLPRLPDSPERAQQEIILQTTLGAPLIAIKGYAAPEVGQTYARAQELCQELEEPPQLFAVLWGLWAFSQVRAELATTRAVGKQLLQLAHRHPSTEGLVGAHLALGEALFLLGELSSAREHLEQCLALYDPQQHTVYIALYGLDPGLFCLSWLPHVLWHLGYPDQALIRCHELLRLARKTAHPFSLAFALDYAAMFHQFRGDSKTAYQLADAAILHCTEHGFALYLAWGKVIQGWARMAWEDRKDGMVQLRQGIADWQATGAALRLPHYFALLAEQYGKVRQPEDGLQVLTKALALVDETGERFYEAELYRLAGELALQQATQKSKGKSQKAKIETNPQPLTPSPQAEAEAEACLLKAIAIARQQQAKSLELRAVMSLVRLRQQQTTQDASRTTQHETRAKLDEAHTMLSEVYHWFTEGFDTKDLQEAKTLIEELTH